MSSASSNASSSSHGILTNFNVRVGISRASRARSSRVAVARVVVLDLEVRDARRHDQARGRDAHLAAAAELRVDEARVVVGAVPDAVLLLGGQVAERLASYQRDRAVEGHGLAKFLLRLVREDAAQVAAAEAQAKADATKAAKRVEREVRAAAKAKAAALAEKEACLLYTSDAADE